jgi:hypothetical protein
MVKLLTRESIFPTRHTIPILTPEAGMRPNYMNLLYKNEYQETRAKSFNRQQSLDVVTHDEFS